MRKFSRPYGLLFLSFSLLILISGVSAQSNSTAQGDQASKNIMVQLDNATWISDITWRPENSSQVKVEVYSEIPKQVGIQEIPDFKTSSGSFTPMKQVTLSPGKNTIYVEPNGISTLGRGTVGIAITDSNDGAFYVKNPRIPIEEAQALEVVFFISASLIFYEVFTRLRIWFKNLRLSRNPKRA